MSKAHLYINSKGYEVNRHSYSGGEAFHFCARKYYLERVQGWSEKQQRGASQFGIAIEKGVTFFHQHRLDAIGAVAEFTRLWAEHKDKPYTYTKVEGDWEKLNLSGQELVKVYTVLYPTFPYIVSDTKYFQVESNFEVFPGSKLAGIQFTAFIDLIAQIKDSFEPIIIDMKTSGKDIPELISLDPQLRSYAWVKSWSNVAFLWFRKCGRTMSKGDTVMLLEAGGGLKAGTEAILLAKDLLGGWYITENQRVVDEIDAKFVGKSKAVEEQRWAYITSNGVLVPERILTKQRVQFRQAVIPPESAEDIGRSIKQDIVNIATATEKDFFPMQSGVRYPNEKCPNCPMRGICSNNAELRDSLLTRNQRDEFDFSAEGE